MKTNRRNQQLVLGGQRRAGKFFRNAMTVLVVLGLAVAAHARGMATGQVLDRMQLLSAVDRAMAGKVHVPVTFSSGSYAEVRREWIKGFMERFRADLSRKDVPVNLWRGDTGWRPNFNCTAFTDLFLGNAAAELMRDLWHSSVQAERPAIVAVWYTPEDGPVDPVSHRRPAHSVVLVLTDQGPVFVDPQRGEVRLTDRELATVIHRRA
jgi:hypothetical protein